MKKKITCIALAFFILFSYSINAVAADNTTEQTIAESKQNLQVLDDKIKTLDTEIANLNAQIDNLSANINKNNNDIAETEKQIQTTQSKLDEKRNEIKYSEDLLGNRLRSMYKSGVETSYLSVLLSSTGFTDFLSKLSAIEKIISLDKQLITNLNVEKESLNESISDLNKKNGDLKELKSKNEAILNQLNDKKKEQEELAQQFDKEKDSLSETIASNETKLISHSLAVVDSASPSQDDLREAISTLNGLVPQISTKSVKQKALAYITLGTNKLNALIASSGNSTNEIPSRGDSVPHKATLNMSATAYTGGSLTALGLKTLRDPNGISTIAVDPSVIPLGSKVYVSGYGYAIAADTGGAIKGSIIDLYFNSEDDCNSWGRRNVTVYIVAYPNEW